jgi:hydrogenase maturation protease
MANPAGVALVTFENSRVGNTGFASALCDSMPARVLKDVCRFNLASPTGLLADYLAGHKAAVIVDSTQSGTALSTVCILDLSTMLERAVPLKIGSTHGLALVDELQEAKRLKRLPGRIILFGFEVDAAEWAEEQSNQVEPILQTSVKNASLLLETIVETLKKDASAIMRAHDASRGVLQVK